MQIKFTQSARKHRIGKARALFVIAHYSPSTNIGEGQDADRFTKEEKMAHKAKIKYTVGPDVDLSKTVLLGKNGKRITNARAERLALAAIEKVVGRPSLTAKFVESPQVQFRIPMKLKKALDKEAKRRGETKSAIVREALEKYLKSA